MAETRNKVSSTPKSVKRNAANGGHSGTQTQTRPTAGFTALPVVPEDDSQRAADYYRNGQFQEIGGRMVPVLPPKFLQEFRDEPASIRVYGKGTGKKRTVDEQSKRVIERDFIPPYTKLILEGVQEGHVERSQIIETFGEFYLFMYGERPPMYTFSGTLINSRNINWVSDFYFYYDNFMRGTKCVEYDARVILTYGGRQVEGYILQFSTQTNAAMEQGVPVQLQVVVTKRNQLGFSDDFSDIAGNDQLAQDIGRLLDQIGGKAGVGTSSSNVSKAYNATVNAITEGNASGMLA